MDPGPFIALAFASPGIIAAVGAIWLGSKAIHIWSQRRLKVQDALDRIDEELSELHERLEFHERLLREQQERPRLERDR